MQEIWKDVKGCSGYYLVSSFGNIISTRGKIDITLKSYTSNSGYLFVMIFKKSTYIHQLVAIAFLNHNKNNNLVVDHIDEDKQNNRLDNLQLLSHRENVTKSFKTRNKSSKYIGVCFHKPSKTWFSRILINDKRKFLGAFKHEIDAANAYQNELNKLLN